ncbi:CBS domain-containing protein [Thiocapsa marina]|uniref:Putative signal transduction protein with CBS domains n=1 Tax=Thiocapsa marina 5811 TaxID=768671 RepID=F9UF39_9GAMM|nr:CBS domain-containing protein [Thiocapsa marina]EGV17076.1 putative signal transduction protein with CBS domains [Thiocapsa marina 5811]
MRYLNVGELVRSQETISLGPQSSVQEAAELMAAHRVGAIPVVDAGKLVGLFTERDLLNRVVAKRLQPVDVLLSAVMTERPISVEPGVSLVEGLGIMSENGFRHLPVLAENRVLGVLSCRDIPPDYWIMRDHWIAAREKPSLAMR